MGLVYLCQMSGQVGLQACCCPGQAQAARQEAQGSPDPHDALHAPGCCDVSQIEASLVPSLTERRAGSQPDIAWASPSIAPAAAPRPAARHGSTPARVAFSPPEGPPLYLKTRSLLL